MDSKIFETIFINSNVNKCKTEQCLTEYYRRRGFNMFKAAQSAQDNIINFVEFANSEILNSRNNRTSFYLIEASKDVVLINRDYYAIKKIHTKLLNMQWRDFEFLSSTILEYCFGACDVSTSQATSDGGVDFKGKIPILAIGTKEEYGTVEVYGQSKKYTGNVGVYDIKSFVAFANSKKRNYNHHPQLFMFFTTSDFATNAQTELKENGFIGLSGFQLSTLIFNHIGTLKGKSKLIDEIIVD